MSDTLADAYAIDQVNGIGDPAVNVPPGATHSVVIHRFEDGSVFVGAPDDGSIDESGIKRCIVDAAELYGVGPSGEQAPCRLTTPLHRLTGVIDE